MQKKNLGLIIIIGLAGIVLSFYGGYLLGGKVALQLQEEREQEISRLNELLTSGAIEWDLTTNGVIKTIFDHSLEITGFTETGEEAFSLVVPISQDAEIVSEYVLPEGAPEEQVKGTISTAEGEELKLGEKKIEFEEIKIEDSVFIQLNLKQDYSIEGVRVRVSPSLLLPVE